jgi:hypothetical protein
LINFAPPGPTLYSGARRCNDERVSAIEDVACTTTGILSERQNPNPDESSIANGNQQQTADAAKFNVFEGVEGVTADRPVWYYTTTVATDNPTQPAFGVFRCNMRCHGVVMSTCFYMGNANRNLDQHMNVGAPNGTWCAGGQTQIAPITTGSAAPPEIQKLLADFGRDLVSGRLAEKAARAVRVASDAAQRRAQ